MARRVLVVDDDALILRILRANLEQAHYSVDTAQNGVEALTFLLKFPYDLLISDIVMPEMDGYDLLEHVRQDPQLRHLPVILLTAQTSPGEITRGHIEGADLYITKPFAPAELLTMMERLLADKEEADLL